MPSYPGNIRVFTPRVDLEDVVKAKHMNDVQAEITAIQVALGTDPSGGSNTVRERIEDVETGLAAIPTGADPYPQYYNTPRHEANNHSFVEHNQLSGLASGDPHPQYYNQSRGDARYAKIDDIPSMPETATPYVYAYATWPSSSSNTRRNLNGTIRIPTSWNTAHVTVRAHWGMQVEHTGGTNAQATLRGWATWNGNPPSHGMSGSRLKNTHAFIGSRWFTTGTSVASWSISSTGNQQYGVVLEWLGSWDFRWTMDVHVEAFATRSQ